MGDDENKKKFDKVKLTKEQSMNTGVSFHASDTIITGAGARVVLFGGQRTGLTSDMWVYEPTGDGWTQCFPTTEESPWPAPRTQATLTAIGAEPQSRMVLIGGYVLNLAEQMDVWAVDITVDMADVTQEWSSCECTGAPPPARYGHSATLCAGQNICIFGGQGGKEQYNDVHVLSVAGAEYAWSAPDVSGVPPSVRTAHLALAMPAAGGKVLIHGGFHRVERCLDDAFTRAPRWQKAMRSHSSEAAAAAAAARAQPVKARAERRRRRGELGAVHVWHGGPQDPGARAARGRDPAGRRARLHLRYDGTKNLQDLLLFSVGGAKAGPAMRDIPCAPAPEPRCRHSCHGIGNALIVIGGYNGTLPYAPDVYTLDVEDAAATLAKLVQAPSSPTRRGSSIGRRSSSNNVAKAEDEPANPE